MGGSGFMSNNDRKLDALGAAGGEAAPVMSADDLISMVTAHYQELYRFAYRLTGQSHDAEDLAQETFLIARQKVGALEDPAALRSWLYTVLRNRYLHHARRRRAFGPESLSLADDYPAELDDDGPVDREQLQWALDRLPEAYRLPLLMFYFEDLSYREIAAALEAPLGTVMSRISRAKQRLRHELEAAEMVAAARNTPESRNQQQGWKP